MAKLPSTEVDPNAAWSAEELGTNSLTLAERTEIKKSLPLLDEVIAWFDAQIALYSNPETISGVNPSSKAEDVKNAVLFAQQLIKDYKYKRDEFVERFKKQIEQLNG